MEQSVSRPTDYRLALHDNAVGRTLEQGTKERGKKGQWMEEEGGLMSPLKDAGNSLTGAGF